MAKIYETQDVCETLNRDRAADDKKVPETEKPAENGKSFAQYDIRREIGRGALSVVYEARDAKTGQNVALKLLTFPEALSAEEAEDLAARFERQAQAVARLSHPNLARIVEVGSQQGQHFVAMEYLRGQTLRDRLKHGVLTVPEASALLTQIAGALDVFHTAGLVHRDIKPTNIILLPGGAIKLLDFGIAPPAEAAASAGVVLGTPSYMAPEQVKGEPGAAAADIWALGVLTYEMLAGQLPFTGKNAESVLYQVVHQPPAPAPALPPAVQRVLRRALDKRPSQRYPTAGELAHALNPAAPAASTHSVVSPLDERKPSAPTPSEKKPAEKKPVAPVPAISRKPFSYSWAPGVGVLALFLLGVGGASFLRHPNTNSARKEAVRQSSEPAAPVASVSVPDALPLVSSAPVSSQKPVEPRKSAIMPRKSVVPRKSEVADRSSLTPPHIAKEAVAQATPVFVPPPIRVPPPSAPPVRTAAAPRVSPQTALHTRVQAAVPPARVRVASRQTSEAHNLTVHNSVSSVPVQRIESYREVRRTPEAAAAEHDAAQSAVQSFTLPSGDSADDPEAEARLRKSAWAQSGTASNP